MSLRAGIFALSIFLLGVVNAVAAPLCSAVFDSNTKGLGWWLEDARRPPRLFAEAHTLKFSDINYKILGQLGQGKTPLVLIHGANSRLETFLPMADGFARDRAVVLVDLRGSGKTKEPGVGYDLNQLAGDLLVLLDGLKIEKAILHGHSTGASAALLFASQHPQRVRALSMEDMSGMPYKARTSHNMQETADIVRYLRGMKKSYSDKAEFLHDLQGLSDGKSESFIESMLGKAKLADQDIWRPGKAAGIEEVMLDVGTRDLSDKFMILQAPTLVMKAGNSSRYLTEAQLQTIQMLKPEVEVSRIPDTGHSIHNEQPQAWQSRLLEFIGRVERVP